MSELHCEFDCDELVDTRNDLVKVTAERDALRTALEEAAEQSGAVCAAWEKRCRTLRAALEAAPDLDCTVYDEWGDTGDELERYSRWYNGQRQAAIAAVEGE